LSPFWLSSLSRDLLTEITPGRSRQYCLCFTFSIHRILIISYSIGYVASSSDSSSSSSGSSREIKCPKCSCPFQVPWKGIEDLPTNYFTAGVVTASIRRESVDPNNVVCEICETTQATEFCQDCAMNFCGDCKKVHLKPKMSAHHQFITIDEALKGGSSSSASRILHCQKHPHQEVNSYCKTDQTAVCP